MVKASSLAAKLIEKVRTPAIPYILGGRSNAGTDCINLIGWCVQELGGKKDDIARGSNTSWRNDMQWTGTLQDAQKQGRLVPGALLFIRAAPTAKWPDGDYEHVGGYVGQQRGWVKDQVVVHSSKSRNGVFPSTLKNGWTHVAWPRCIDYTSKQEAPMYNQEYQMPQQPQETPNTPPDTQQSAYIQTGQSAPTLSPFPPFGITTATVTMRKSPNLQGDYMLKIPSGEVIEIIYAVNGWYQTRRTNANGTHTGWVSSIYIAPYTPNNSGQAPSYQASVNQPIYSQQYPQPSYTHQQASDQAHTMHGKSNAPHLTYPSDQSAPNIQPQPTQPPIQEAAPGVPTYNAYPAQPGGTTVTVNVSQSQDVKK